MYVGGVAGVGFSATANAQISSVAYTDLQAGCSQTFTPYAWHYLTGFNGEGHASSQCDDSSTVTVEASVDPDLCAGVVCGDFGTCANGVCACTGGNTIAARGRCYSCGPNGTSDGTACSCAGGCAGELCNRRPTNVGLGIDCETDGAPAGLCLEDRPLDSLGEFCVGALDLDLEYFSDGGGQTYQWMEASCLEKGARMCTFEELCPDGRGQPPVGGRLDGDEWVPVAPSGGRGQDWVQLGTRAEQCSLHLEHEGWTLTPCCCDDWCNTNAHQDWKGIYGCCA